MKTIGLLGGMSWESTKTYYHHLNTIIKQHKGGLNSARILMLSINFSEVEPYLVAGNWKKIETVLIDEAKHIEAGGADCLLICTNTMHKVAPAIADAITIPLFHIADALGDALAKDNVETVGLLGTRFTMGEGFYAESLSKKFGITTLIPDKEDMRIIDDVIFKELCLGIVRDEAREQYIAIMEKLEQRGAQGIALACTEIEMLVKPEHTKQRLYDATYLHAAFAAEWALAQ